MAFTFPRVITDLESGAVKILTRGGLVTDCCCGGDDNLYITFSWDYYADGTDVIFVFNAVKAEWEVAGDAISGHSCSGTPDYMSYTLPDGGFTASPHTHEVWVFDAKTDGEWPNPASLNLKLYAWWFDGTLDPTFNGADVTVSVTCKGFTLEDTFFVSQECDYGTSDFCAASSESNLITTLTVASNGALSFS